MTKDLYRHSSQFDLISGMESVQTAHERIFKSRLVHHAELLFPFQQNETKKDIEVILHWVNFLTRFKSPIFIPKNKLWVEVKSSDAAIETYKQLIIDSHLEYEDELQAWLYENRQIIINGRGNKEIELNQFEQQLDAMNYYWKIKLRK